MTIFVVLGERAFYNDEVHQTIPGAAKAISQADYEALLTAQSCCRLLDFNVFPPAVRERPEEWPSSSALQSLIDDSAAELYAKWSRFEQEFQARERAALQYQDDAYQGEASIWIKSFADPSGLDYIEATLLILRRAQEQREAQEALAVLRMRKLELNALEGKQCYQHYLTLMDGIGKLAETSDT